jgi:hypothetical protein
VASEQTLTFLIRADSTQATSELKKFRAAVNSEVRSIGEGFASQIPGIGRFSNLMSPTALGIAAVGVAAVGTAAGLVTLARNASEAGSRFNDLSLKSGLSVETLSGLDLQLRQSGASLETLTTGFFNLQKQQAAARDGSDQAAAALRRVGVDAKATSEDALRQFVKGLGGIQDAGARNAAGAAVMGKAYKELSVFIADTNGDLDAVVEKARRAGLVMSTEAAQAADAFGDKMDEVTFSLAAAARQMISPALPAFTGVLNDMAGASEGTASGLRAIGQAIASIIDGGRIAAGVLQAIADNNIYRIPGMIAEIRKEQRGRVINRIAGTGGAVLGRAVAGARGDFSEDGGGGKRSGGSAQDDRAALLQQETRALEREYRAQTEMIRREQDLQLTSLRDATERTIQAENDRYDALAESLNKQLALAKKESERERIHGDLREAELERDRNIQAGQDEEYKEERATLEAHTQAMLRRAEQYDRDRIASIKARADLRAITHEQAEEKIARIESAAFKRRLDFNHAQIKALQTLAGFQFDAMGNIIENEAAQARLRIRELKQLQDEGSQIVAEWDSVVIESERRRSEARRKDLENARQWAREMRELELSVLRAALQVGQMDVERMRRRNIDKREVAEAQAGLDREDERLNHERELQRIADAQAEFNEEVHTFEERLAAIKHFNERREIEHARHRARMKEIDDRQKQESGEGGDLLDPLRDELNKRISLHQFAAQAIASTFDTITNAMGATLESYILTGELSGKLIRKAVAEQIAALSALALKQGMYWTAQGIADLFWNPPRAVADFAAAAGFFALAGAGAFIGRKVAGNAFKDQAQNGGSAGGGNDDRQVQYAPFAYNSGASSSSQAAGEGSRNTGGMLERLERVEREGAAREQAMHYTLNRVADAVDNFSRKYDSVRADELIMRNHHAVGEAVLEEQKSNYGFTLASLQNTGFNR